MRLATFFGKAAGYLFTNRVHVFFMPVFLTMFWNMIAKLPLTFEYYIMITCTTAGGYIYNMYTDLTEDHINYSGRYRLVRSRTWPVKLVIFLCFFTGLLLSLRAGWVFVLYGGLVHLISSLYSMPLRLKHKAQPFRIKETLFWKNVYPSLFWSAALILTPYLYVGVRPTSLAALAVVISFGLAYFVELLWDLRDIPGDSQAGVRTLPLAIGETASCWLLRTVHVATCALTLYGVQQGLLTTGFLIAAVHLPLGLLFLEWYLRLPEKELASHLYLVYAGSLLVAGMVWNWFDKGGMV